MNEKWLPIIGYEGLYEVSNFGYIKAVKKVIHTGKNLYRTYESKVLRPGNNRGYLRVALCKNGTVKNTSIHRIVAQHFVDGYFEGAQVNHKDGNKLNNHFSNLEWVTSKENTIHAHKNGLIKKYTRSANTIKKLSESKKGLKHPFSRPLIDLNTGVFYESILEAANLYGIAHSSLRSLIKQNKINLVYA